MNMIHIENDSTLHKLNNGWVVKFKKIVVEYRAATDANNTSLPISLH